MIIFISPSRQYPKEKYQIQFPPDILKKDQTEFNIPSNP